ncbi:SNF2-related protein [Micromonospora sp. NPDC023737]|uniref:DEAD/DEAH box helicase n=1 Tax=unclassified Micromonospora TaxID=2617518 RepID=UPI0033CBC5DE
MTEPAFAGLGDGPAPPALPESDFTQVPLRVSYSTGEQPLTRFYVPLLARAIEYRRLVGYFSAKVLARAAAGFAPLAARRARMQLVVGAQLSDEDVDAVLRGEPLDQVVAERLCLEPLTEGVSIVQKEHLRLLAWMLREGLLELRVGVPVDSDGTPLRPEHARRYFHSKYGLFTDALGRQVAFSGSDNETVAGWTGNHETFHVYWSWNDAVWPLYGADVTRRLEQHWDGTPDTGWAVLPVPTALRQGLINIVPAGWTPPAQDPDPRLRDFDVPDDPLGGGPAPGWAPTPAEDSKADENAIEADRVRLLEMLRAPLSRTMVGVASAAAVPLPHQQLIAVRAVETYPRGYLLADEVGLGKTIEAGLILRELLLSGRAETALLLVPASVMSQWQEELHEKISLDVPRYEGGVFLDRHNREISFEPTANPWTAFPVVLASSHLARRVDRREQVLAGSWDVVLVDEAHHARRRGLKANGTPNTLLGLLQTMKARQSWKALYLASATPMQMAPHEAWDLIELLGLPGEWSESADKFVRYFAELRRPHADRDWALLSRMLRDELDAPDAAADEPLRNRVVSELGPVVSRSILRLHQPPPPSRQRVLGWKVRQCELADEWLRAHTPMRDRVFRHTRGTMRRYQEQGLLPADLIIPRRTIRDEFIELSPAEWTLYERIDAYISRYYNAYMAAGPGNPAARALGFIMTVYRRRLTSSFQAVRLSLKRRREALAAGRALAISELLDPDDKTATEDDESGVDLTSVADPISADLLAAEIAELDSFIADIEALGGQDTKAEQLYGDLNEALLSGYDSVVLFTQYTDTMDYLRDRLAGPYQRVACYSGRGGERWDPATSTWTKITKNELKQLFREGEIRILLGTDSMSEGLNLQTSGRLFNYDMPWNLMRVEQRIGRVDRIGASHEVVTISNYFYADTVEQAIYSSIKDDFGDFTEIVGDAQPVLAATEAAIKAAAMAAGPAQRDAAAAQAARDIRDRVQEATSGDVRLSDAEQQTLSVPELHPSDTLADLATAIVGNKAVAPWLTADPTEEGAWELALPGAPPQLVSFDRAVVDASKRDVALFTWGTAEAKALAERLEAATPGDAILPAPRQACDGG